MESMEQEQVGEVALAVVVLIVKGVLTVLNSVEVEALTDVMDWLMAVGAEEVQAVEMRKTVFLKLLVEEEACSSARTRMMMVSAQALVEVS